MLEERGKNNKHDDKRKGPDMTIAVVKRSKLCNTRDNKSLSQGGRKWFPVHRTSQHDFDECYIIKRKVEENLKAIVAEHNRKQTKLNINGDEPKFHEVNQSLAHIFIGSTMYESKRHYKAVE